MVTDESSQCLNRQSQKAKDWKSYISDWSKSHSWSKNRERTEWAGATYAALPVIFDAHPLRSGRGEECNSLHSSTPVNETDPVSKENTSRVACCGKISCGKIREIEKKTRNEKKKREMPDSQETNSRAGPNVDEIECFSSESE